MKVNIIKFDHFGRGIAKVDNKVVFVDKALPNEVLDIDIRVEKSKYSEGTINKIIARNPQRIEPICPYYDKCGGCNFLHVDYKLEKEFKINKANELLARCDSFYETNNWNYRNKVILHVNGNSFGIYEDNTRKIVDIDYCYLLDDKINKVISDLKKIDLKKYHFGKIIIKANNNMTLVDVDKEVDNDFIKCFDYVDTIISKEKVVKGKGFIKEKVDNFTFKITSNAFFQVNKVGLENIYHIIKEYLRDKTINQALDLYSGTSVWGILISNMVGEVTSIEINKEACLNAKDNIKNNNINNIKVINGNVDDYIDNFKDIDLVIVDPPRSGLNNKTTKYLKTIGSKYIIYISCDMHTLKRDIAELNELYNVVSINLVDMFKGTYHVETVCLLCRKTIDK